MMTNSPNVPPEPVRNPATKSAFRQQVWLQIYLPLVAGIALLALIAFLLWNTGLAGTSPWADASLILLMIPVLIISIIPLVLLIGLIYAVAFVSSRIPVPAHQIQQSIAQVNRVTARTTEKLVKPMIIIKAGGAAAKATVQELTEIIQRK